MYVKIGDNVFPVDVVFETRRDEVSPEAITAVTTYLADFFDKEIDSSTYSNPLSGSLYRYLKDNYFREFIIAGSSDGSCGGDSGLDAVMDWSTDKSRGKLVTRLSKYFIKRFGYRLPKEQKTQIGNILNNSTGVATYRLLISRGMHWDAGAYGDSKSCFWNSRSSDRQALNREDVFYSVRVFRNDGSSLECGDDDGLARCLLYFPLGTMHGLALVFNGYGMSSGMFTRILSQPSSSDRMSQSMPIQMDIIGHDTTPSVFINPSSSYAILPQGYTSSSNIVLLFDGAENKFTDSRRFEYNRDVYGVCDSCKSRALVQSAVDSDSRPDGKSFDLTGHFTSLGFSTWQIPDLLSVTPPCTVCGQRNVRSAGRRHLSVPLPRATIRMAEFYGECRYVLADKDEACAYPLFTNVGENHGLFLVAYMECFPVMDDGVRSVVYVKPSDVRRFNCEYVWDANHWVWVKRRATSPNQPLPMFENIEKNMKGGVVNE